MRVIHAELGVTSDETFERVLRGHKLVGLDFEWVADSSPGLNNPIALIQICGQEPKGKDDYWVLLIRTHKCHTLPESLMAFFDDRSVAKSISGDMKNDTRKFKYTFGESIDGLVSTSAMALDRGYSKPGLASMTKVFFDVSMNPFNLEWKWDSPEELEEDAIFYAASDAFYTLQVCMALENEPLILNNSGEALIDFGRIVGKGKFRKVAKGVYKGGPKSKKPCVAKWFKNGCVYNDESFTLDLAIVAKAAEIVKQFNALTKHTVRKVPRVFINQPSVWIKPNTGKHIFVEPFIPNFYKYNSNTGATAGHHFLQALSHFSYHQSNGEYLLCDLQGGRTNNAFILGDPVIMSVSKEFGSTDLGYAGICNFFAHHKCTKFCKKHWKTTPEADTKAYFKAVMHTSFSTFDYYDDPDPMSSVSSTSTSCSTSTSSSMRSASVISITDSMQNLSFAPKTSLPRVSTNAVDVAAPVRRKKKYYPMKPVEPRREFFELVVEKAYCT